MDVFGHISIDYETPDICHIFYSDNDDPLIDATLDLTSGEVVYLREEYSSGEHKFFLEEAEESLESVENSYDFAGQVNDYARY